MVKPNDKWGQAVGIYSLARSVACWIILGINSRRHVPSVRPILQVRDQVFILRVRDRVVRAVGLSVAVNDFGKAFHHVRRLKKSNLRYYKLFRPAFLMEENVSTWRQVKFNQSSEVKSSRTRTPWSFWYLWYWIVLCTYVAGAKKVSITDLRGSCDHKGCYEFLGRA